MKSNARSCSGKAVLAAIVAAVVVVIAGGALWWWLGSGTDRRPAGPPEAITLAASLVYPGSALIQIAEANGYFAAEGLQVTIQPHPTGKASLDAVLAGQADAATVADIPVMFAALKGAPVAILAAMSTTDAGEYGIVARRDRGVTEPAGLKRKKIGVPAGTSAHYFVDSLMLRRHVDASEYVVTNVPTARMSAALAAGEVDAIGVWEPYLSEVKQVLGDKGITFSETGIYDSPWLLATRRELAGERAEAMRRLLRALLRAEQYYAAEPAAAVALLAKVRNEEPARVERLLSGFRFGVRLGQSLLGTLEDEARWAIRNKVVEGASVPNFLNYVHLDALKAVNPERITIVH